MIKAIIFDFDGVLILSEWTNFKLAQSIVAKYNYQIPDNLFAVRTGKIMKNFLREILEPRFNQQKIDKIADEYYAEYLKNTVKYIEPMNLTIDFIKSYNGNLKLAIASMSSREIIEKVTKFFGINSKINCIVSRDEITRYKPDPEIYTKTVKKLGLKPKECIVIEDTALGVESAKNAGLKCFVLLNSVNREQDFSEMNIAGFIRSQEDLLVFKLIS